MSAVVLPQVPDVLIDPTSVTRCFRITKQIGLLATGLGRKCSMQLVRWHPAGWALHCSSASSQPELFAMAAFALRPWHGCRTPTLLCATV